VLRGAAHGAHGIVAEWDSRSPARSSKGAAPRRTCSSCCPNTSTELREQPELSYGWGCIAATVTLGVTTFTSALMPRQQRYLVPMKVAVRRTEGVDLGDVVTLRVEIAEPTAPPDMGPPRDR